MQATPPTTTHDPLIAIRQAEQAVTERVREAEADAQAQVVQAQARAKLIEHETQLAARQEVAATLEAVHAELAAETAQLLAAADRDAQQIRTRARLRQEVAVEAILAYILRIYSQGCT